MEKEIIHNSHRSGKSIFMLAAFIAQIKSGVSSIILGPGYVVLSRKEYDKLIDKQIKYKIMEEGR